MYHTFSARQSVCLPVPPPAPFLREYLHQSERIVETIGRESCIEPLGDRLYRLRMRPLQFFALQVEPIVDMEVWTTRSSLLCLRSTTCELKGIEGVGNGFSLNLSGTLQPEEERGSVSLKGGVEFSLRIYLPSPFSLIPKQIVRSTGDRLVATILLSMKKRLMRQLLADYRQWLQAKQFLPLAS